MKLRLPGVVKPTPPPISNTTGIFNVGFPAFDVMMTFPVYVPEDNPLGSRVTCNELPFGVVPELALMRIHVAEVLTVNANSEPGCELLISTLRTTGVDELDAAWAMIVPGLARRTGADAPVTFRVAGIPNVPLVVETVTVPL